MTEPLSRRIAADSWWALALIALSTQACGGGDDDDDSACDDVTPVRETQMYGQPCEAFVYGDCETVFDDCVQGRCLNTKNGQACTQNCASTSECPSGLYCVANGPTTKACTTAATCNTVCDEEACCTYLPVEGDPTSCVLDSCKAGGF